MTTACCDNIKPNIRKQSVGAINKQNVIVFLVCLTVIVQYAMLLIYGGDSEVEDADFGVARYCALINYCLYFIIILINLEKIKHWQFALLIFGVAYLVINTAVRGKGVLHLFSYVEFLIALIVFSQMRLSRKQVKSICVFSVVLMLLFYLLLSYDGKAYFYSEFLNVKLNQNHFCKLVIINLYLILTALRKCDRKIHLSYLIAYAVGLYIVIPTGSRMATICLIALIFFHILSVKLKKVDVKKLLRFFTFCLVVSVFTVLIFAYVVPVVLGDDFTIFGRTLLSGRELIYKDAFKTLINENELLFGHGFMKFTELKGPLGTYRTDTHNQWLQFALNYGLVFVLFMFVAYRKVFKKMVQNKPSDATLLLVFLQIIILVYFVAETLYHLSVYSCLYHIIFFTNYASTESKNGDSRFINLTINRRK